MGKIDERDLETALETAEAHTKPIESEIFDEDGWIPSRYRKNDRLRLDIETNGEEITDREWILYKIGKIEGRTDVVTELSRELFGD